MLKISLSIVIVSYNTREYVRRCLDSILSQANPLTIEIIVVDNASTDHTVENLQPDFKSVRFISNPENYGFSHACNVGWKNATGKYILFSNGDIYFPVNSIDEMLKGIQQDDKIGILSPSLRSETGDLIQMTWGWNISILGEVGHKLLSPKYIKKYSFIRNLVEKLQSSSKSVKQTTGACILVRHEMMDAISGFDQNYELYFEDVDLCVRCWKSGYRIQFEPQICVMHALGQSAKKQSEKIGLIYRQSQIYFYKIHHSYFQLLALKCYLTVKFLFTGKFWTSADFRHYILGIILERRKLHLRDNIQLQN